VIISRVKINILRYLSNTDINFIVYYCCLFDDTVDSNSLQQMLQEGGVIFCTQLVYHNIHTTLCLKKTSLMFLTITIALSDFHNIWQKYY